MPCLTFLFSSLFSLRAFFFSLELRPRYYRWLTWIGGSLPERKKVSNDWLVRLNNMNNSHLLFMYFVKEKARACRNSFAFTECTKHAIISWLNSGEVVVMMIHHLYLLHGAVFLHQRIKSIVQNSNHKWQMTFMLRLLRTKCRRLS